MQICHSVMVTICALVRVYNICTVLDKSIFSPLISTTIVMLEEVALLPLQAFWWQQTLEFWNTIAASSVDSLFHR